MTSRLPVFVCGTYSDLSAERGAVLDALQRLQVEHHSMELFGARSTRSIETCLDEVRKSKIVVIVVGHQYGTLVPGMQISFSEAEYQEAYALGLECLPYFHLGSAHQDPRQGGDADALALQKWKKTLEERHTPAYFDDPNKLATQVAIDVGRAIQTIEAAENSVSNAAPLIERRLSLQSQRRFSPVSCQRFGDESRQLLHGLTRDNEGNILIVGDFWGSIDFGRKRLKSAGDRDIFVAKFNRAGSCLWSNGFGDRFEQVGVGVATDAERPR